MSGTSLDGVDCAVTEFCRENDVWTYRFITGETIPYPKEWYGQLKNAMGLTEADLHLLNIEYTYFLGELLNEFITRNDLNDLDLIASHGHTVLHQPENGITLQIGNLPLIADTIALPFICDFRVQDVALGGQGAPLVPVGDRLLFSDFDYCLNLGGFSNISFEKEGQRVAFDICPVNTLLNHFAELVGKDFDKGGEIAASGSVSEELLKALNSLDFYDQQGPKSLGAEQVEQVFLPLIGHYKLEVHDILSTLTEHMAFQIAKSLTTKGRVLVTGGGAYNIYLLERLKFYATGNQIEPGPKELIDFKEAIIFGFLGALRRENKINVLCSVTGASQDHCSGNIFNEDLLATNCENAK